MIVVEVHGLMRQVTGLTVGLAVYDTGGGVNRVL